MSSDIAKEINKFNDSINHLKTLVKIEKRCENGYVLYPLENKLSLPPSKQIALTFGAIVHGNEVGGLRILNELLSFLASETIKPRVSLAFFLGNPEASKANQRFLEQDLNRSFGSKRTSQEGVRAKELESILNDTMWFLDFHQTRLRTETPFFIFPYRKKSFEFACHISSYLPIVTHWGHGFSNEGMCSDEFVNVNGGVGITLETGVMGFNSLQVSLGVKSALHAIRYVTHMIEGSKFTFEIPSIEERVIYTMKDVVVCPQTGPLKLRKGLYNFQALKKGESLTVAPSQDVTSSSDGPLLFPNYSAEKCPENERPPELARILRKVRPEELPQI